MADRISNLPDEILGRILSFLPTENVVATSVLSKRWKLLWHLVSTLDFDYDRYLEDKEWESEAEWNTPFINFVSAAILSPGLHQPIKNFKLTYDPPDEFPYSDVEAWFKAAIQRQVQNLELEFNYSQMPCCILSCSTLVVLDLYGVKFDAFSSVHLPALKTLHMKEVVFSNNQFFVELLNGCPILENLEVVDLSLHDETFEGKVKTLPKLVRAEFFSQDQLFFIPMKAYSNVKFLRINQCDVDIPMFPNLIYLELSVGYHVKWSVALDMLNHCPKLQTVVFHLTFDGEDDVWPDPGFVPECFSSHLRKCFLEIFAGLGCEKRFARYVMQNSTLLRTMTISGRYPPNHPKMLEILTELSSYPRSSAVCELLIK